MRRGKLRIIYEDSDILVVDKPPGLLTSTVPREKRATLLAVVREHVHTRQPRARVGLIHRLDRDASGLLVFSKNNSAYASLKRQFFHHTVERIYSAIVRGVPSPRSGRIDTRLLELPDGRMVRTKHPKRGQRAITDYETIAIGNGLSLLRVRLLTGRKHQIRSQLAQRGHPVLNDPIYDNHKPKARLMLAATELGFEHPCTGQTMMFRIDIPREMAALFPDLQPAREA